MKTLSYFAILFLIFINCKKEEEMITGDITGKIKSYSQYGFNLQDQPDITVSLFQDNTPLETTITDEQGQYLFSDRVYGRYKITCEKEKFVRMRGTGDFKHIGGYSPTITNYSMFEVPTYELLLDSVGYFEDHNMITIHLKLNGDTILPVNYYGLSCRVFTGNSPDLSRENYISQGKAFLADYSITEWGTKTAVFAGIYEYNMDQNFSQLRTGPIYIRLYPIAMGQGYGITDYYPEALGPPSNVIGFNWDDIAGNR